jgi:hypothetical protein
VFKDSYAVGLVAAAAAAAVIVVVVIVASVLKASAKSFKLGARQSTKFLGYFFS